MGIDPGLATFGWAVVDGDCTQYRLVAFGVLIQAKHADHNVTTSTVKRARHLASAAHALARNYEPNAWFIEQLSRNKWAASAQAQVAMAFGVCVAASMAATLHQVAPQVWQKAHAPEVETKARYNHIFGNIERLVLSQSWSANQWHRIKQAHRTHAADAIAIAIFGAKKGANVPTI